MKLVLNGTASIAPSYVLRNHFVNLLEGDGTLP